jgi:proteasome lid subunit RPN8/RPN11
MLLIPQNLYEEIRRHGEETYPHECCGILLGTLFDWGWKVSESLRAGNTRTDSAHNRYHIAPLELVKAERESRRLGLEIAGFYHSHPDHPALWSQTDFEEAHWLGCSYVITAVVKGHATETNSFRLLGPSEEEKHFMQEAVQSNSNETSIRTENQETRI